MRVKTGKTRRRRHKKVLKATKGHKMTRNRLYKRAHESYMHAGHYSYAHRRKRSSQMRREWIKRIKAAVEQHGMKYSVFIHKLKQNNITLDRKVLADLAFNSPKAFTRVVESL